MIAIIGASGFIGKNIQYVLMKSYKLNFSDIIMVYFDKAYEIDDCFNKVKFDKFIENNKIYNNVETIIVTAGNSSRNIDCSNFSKILKKDTEYLFKLKGKFNSNIILLSSCAVYDGCMGKIKEDYAVMPNSLYGICKYNAEMAAKYAVKTKKLLIFRLMYAYGRFEKSKRFMPLIKKSIKNDEMFNVNGYNNYLNPLSGEFVAKVLIEAALKINDFPKFDIVNLSSLKKITVLEVLKTISYYTKFRYKLISKEPIFNYWPSIDKFQVYLKKLSLLDEEKNVKLIDYFKNL